MSTLVIPDIHAKVQALPLLEELIAKASHTVYLGDLFDTFSARKHAEELCQYILSHIDDPKRTWLYGNHDVSYAFPHDWCKCSGYDRYTQDVVSLMIPRAVWERWKLYVRVGKYLLSHAGFTPQTIRYATPEVEQETIRAGLEGEYDPVWGAGHARGGRLPVGGPTWCDWDREFIHVDGTPQIVGHTPSRDVRVKGHGDEQDYCIDTDLTKVAWIDDDGAVTIERL